MSEPLWPADYGVGADHCGDVLRGSYDVPFNPEKPPRILDIGANVGAFCIWATKRWQGCSMWAYEPHPGTFQLLRRTIERERLHDVAFFELGVDASAGVVKIHSGPNNIGEASIVMKHNTPSFDVQIIDAATLPPGSK